MKGHRRASRSEIDRMRSLENPLNGVGCKVLRKPPAGCPALFMDRDGAVAKNSDYSDLSPQPAGCNTPADRD